MSELFETFDVSGEPAGLVERSAVHAQGLWHRAAHVWLFTSDGRLHIQRRAAHKDVCADLWDFSVGEHLRPGESYADGAQRGLAEELGVTDVRLEPLGEERHMQLEIAAAGLKDFEMQRSFRGRYDGPVAPDPDEVAEVRLITLDALQTWLARAPGEFTPWFVTDVVELGILKPPAQPPPRTRRSSE